ncbi:SGNH/GDSL hydrolase family protein [Paenarthrobacter sp. Y-19]|uniref:SGNH/GDSL hydrolase family protein n=1 Tax=Paenarthrobacter sp. Y-19 TaxID=3031125 RepID=UPI0023DB5565|nr:SGNH/GDSL hydrolase family protein [Paenarthrobacter sp. Y-19]
MGVILSSSSRRRAKRNKLIAVGAAALLVFGGLGTALALGVGRPAVPEVSSKVAEYYAQNSAVPTPTKDTRPLAVFIGDSYTQGVGASAAPNKWVEVLAAKSNLAYVNLGKGGTGYVSTSGPSGCGLSFCPAYKEMVQQGLAEKDATYFVVSGGQNDFDDFKKDPAAVTAAVEDVYQTIRAGLPTVKIVAVGPSTPWGVDPLVLGLDKAVQDAAAKVGATYVSMIDPPAFNANMIAKDKAHVTDAGHAAIAERVATALR